MTSGFQSRTLMIFNLSTPTERSFVQKRGDVGKLQHNSPSSLPVDLSLMPVDLRKPLGAVKRVKEAKYLGLWFEESGKWTTHAKERITKAKQALYSLRQQGAIAQGLGIRTAQIAAKAIVKSTLPYGLCITELSKSWWKKIEAVWNETARSVLQVHRRTVAGVCRAELGWLTIKA
ncbi:hypothetical protein QOT17_003870 [Balamuthia mandrillaris]